MADAVTASPQALRARYAEAFRAWLAHRDERELGTAYALGREAVSAQLSVLDLAEAHHDAMREALRAEPDPERRAELIAAAGAFFGEALSTFEIAHRGYHEVQEVARLEHEHVTELRALADASVKINAAMTTEEALQLTAEAACRILRAQTATVTSTAGDPFARALSAAAPAEGSGPEPTGAPIGVMLRSAGRPLGVLEVAGDPARVFTARDEAILAQLGQLASVAIAKSQAYMRERHIAQVLQRSLLPTSLPPLDGFTAAVRFVAAGEGVEVGGDFYDLFRAGNASHVAALIGDVCGKGPEAASVTALARHTLRAAAAYERRPSELLALLHRALRDARDDDRFCTVAYCELEPHAGGARLTLACGGHPLPLVLRASGVVEPVGKLGTLLGADVEPALTDTSVELAPGDLLVLYTDGVTEVRAARREVFGYRDLAQLLARCAGLDPDTVAQRVHDAVLEAAGGRPRDDIAILIVGPTRATLPAAPHGTLPGAPSPREDMDG